LGKTFLEQLQILIPFPKSKRQETWLSCWKKDPQESSQEDMDTMTRSPQPQKQQSPDQENYQYTEVLDE
jgi:hypothetical protein